MTDILNMSCPIAISRYPQILLAHGGGGKLMYQLITEMLVPTFQFPTEAQHDSAVFHLNGGRLAFTTDSYVVRPLFFAGGDIGKLAVYGTVNDLAMSGARPLYLSLSFILEEGLPMEVLWQIVQSIQASAEHAHVQIITGDTKVVDRGKGDGIFINTAGIGVIEHDLVIHPASIRVGDHILVNGDLGRHGIAIMSQREDLGFEADIESDTAPLADLVLAMIEVGIRVHCLRDLTRGGLASALVELATASQWQFHIYENRIPVNEAVRGACEILGLDPLHIANEGRFVAFVHPEDALQALALMRQHPAGTGAVDIGEVTDALPAKVTLQSLIGVTRIVDMLSGEQLPRIC